jgi:hypothetical protein
VKKELEMPTLGSNNVLSAKRFKSHKMAFHENSMKFFKQKSFPLVIKKKKKCLNELKYNIHSGFIENT